MRRIMAMLATMCVLAGATACGSDSKKSTGAINVFAAASLTEAFNDAKAPLSAEKPAITPTYNFAASSALAQQIQQGAPADVFASADEKNMQTLVDANLVETPKVFVRNKLEIAVSPNNPKKIGSLGDLEQRSVILVLADKAVPAGNYALQAFEKAGLPEPKPKSLEVDVKAALAKVVSGEADAAVVYATDVKAAGSQVEGVEILDAQNVIATYPIAVVKSTKHHDSARQFVDDMVSGAGQPVLLARGFLAPS
jgi:molybdate transport system substrate-binding protein